MLIHYNLFSGSAERNEFLIDSEARSAESLYDDAPNARRRMRLSIRVIYIDVRKDRIIDKLINYWLTRDFKYEFFRDQWIPRVIFHRADNRKYVM